MILKSISFTYFSDSWHGRRTYSNLRTYKTLQITIQTTRWKYSLNLMEGETIFTGTLIIYRLIWVYFHSLSLFYVDLPHSNAKDLKHVDYFVRFTSMNIYQVLIFPRFDHHIFENDKNLTITNFYLNKIT